MSVVLVCPPNPSMRDPRIAPPLGLLYLVAWYRTYRGAGVSDPADWRVVDLNTACYQPDAPNGHWTHDFSIARCLTEIPGGADVYGLSLASMQLPHGRALARALRQREPQATLVAGGSHASALPDECADPVAMSGGHFDVVVTQEGEQAFADVLDTIVTGFRSVPSHWRRSASGNGWIVRGRPVDRLDDLPFPAREKLDFHRYSRRIRGEAATNIITSRGCPARCSFCQQDSLWGSGLRLNSPERVLAEVDDIARVTGIRNLLFLDDTLTARRRICAGLRERGVLWRGWTRANLCVRPGDDAMLGMMADSGCQALCVGVESGSDRVLKALNKGTSVDVNSRAVRAVAGSGMDCRISVMVGSPHETWEDVHQLVNFVAGHRDHLADWILSSFVPLPGTPAWDDPDGHGLVIDKERARAEGYRHFFVVGGAEQSGCVHRLADGSGPADVQARHDYVQESLLRLAPRRRREVTVGLEVEAS